MHHPKVFLQNFRSFLPAISTSQDQSMDWLVAAHVASARQSSGSAPSDPTRLFSRFGCQSPQIERRFSVLPDFEHTDFERMEIFHLHRNPRGAGSGARMRLFSRVVTEAFERFYREETEPPSTLLHVTCTGYDAPSGAERLVARKGWGDSTDVYHLYHMGCYAAIPAIRVAAGLHSQDDSSGRIDIVHTELCSIHLDPSLHGPEQIVVQSLFADGLIRYSLDRKIQCRYARGLELLATRKELIPGSEDSMTWRMGDFGMEMTLSRKVPELIAGALYPFLEKLSSWNDETIFAIHPGGPRIIDQIQDLLRLEDRQLETSRKILRQRGNMSSATLPHIWMDLLEDPAVPHEADIISLAFGPGLTLCGNVLRKTEK